MGATALAYGLCCAPCLSPGLLTTEKVLWFVFTFCFLWLFARKVATISLMSFNSVSQIDHGVVNLTNEEDSRITVLLDCHGISPFRFPMQMMRSFIIVVQENYPNRLGVLFVVRLPPVVRVIAQTFLQVR